MSSTKSNLAKDHLALRVVTQYREKTSMIYELMCGDAELDVRISPRQSSEDHGDWRIEARPGRASGAACVAGWASTRREALLEVGRKWASAEAPIGLPSFDWEAVARVLTAVSAL